MVEKWVVLSFPREWDLCIQIFLCEFYKLCYNRQLLKQNQAAMRRRNGKTLGMMCLGHSLIRQGAKKIWKEHSLSNWQDWEWSAVFQSHHACFSSRWKTRCVLLSCSTPVSTYSAWQPQITDPPVLWQCAGENRISRSCSAKTDKWFAFLMEIDFAFPSWLNRSALEGNTGWKSSALNGFTYSVFSSFHSFLVCWGGSSHPLHPQWFSLEELTETQLRTVKPHCHWRQLKSEWLLGSWADTEPSPGI